MREMSRRAANAWVSLALVAGVSLLYAQVAQHDFLSLDDPSYVFDNPQVRDGLTWDGVGWAFTTFHRSNWHPLTWLSHMVDCEWFALEPGGPHLVNAGLHATNAVLLFLVLRLMTGALWPSALVAALFAVHPLRVESVAWISERKDVLSGLFWMLTLLTYVSYVRRPGMGRYLLLFTSLALGLMAKPMLVTLPLVLLLLDIWPLGRLSQGRRLILEKLPLLGLALAMSAVTLFAQQRGGALGAGEDIPFGLRLANAGVAYVAYLGKTFWPTHLAGFYPHPALVSEQAASALIGPGMVAALALVGVSLAAAYTLRARPYFAVGWLWYLITLFPVIGILQVGFQAMADRYAYLPLVGIYIALAWGGRELALRWPRSRPILGAAAVFALGACALITWHQVGTWRDSVTLFEHAIEVTDDNYFAHGNLAAVLVAQGQVAEATDHYQRALQIKPDYPTALTGLGSIYSKQGRLAEAEAQQRRALELQPESPVVLNNLGAVSFQQGKLTESAEYFEHALRIQPDYAMGHSNLGGIYFRLGRLDRAASHLERALILEPNYPAAHNNLGALRVQQGRLVEAAYHFERTLRIQPDHPTARRNLRDVRAVLAAGQ